MVGSSATPPDRGTGDDRRLLSADDLDRVYDQDGTPLSRSGHAILVVDDQGRYVGATTPALILLEYALADLCTKTVADLTAPEQQDLYSAVWKQFEKRGQGTGFYTVVTGRGHNLAIRYEARSNVLPGIHLSHIQAI